jgi:DNA polymerase-3 subunit delta
MNGNLYLLAGNDSYLMKKRSESIMADHGVDSVDVEFFDMDETAVEDAVNAAMTIPFLSERKGVVLKNCQFLAPIKPGKEPEHLLPYLIRYLRNPNPTTIFILQAPYDKMDTRKALYKICLETCHFEECLPAKKEDMYPLIRKVLKNAGKTMDANALEEFVNRTNDNTFLALNELDKLLQYVDETEVINLATVQKVTTRNLEDNVFELVNSILAKDMRSVTNIYQDLMRNNIDSGSILSLITGKFQEILYTKSLIRTNKSFEDIMRYFNATKGRTYYIVKNAREITDELLNRYLTELEKVDFRIKSGALDKKIGVELFVMGL